jgi:hypothetical protein
LRAPERRQSIKEERAYQCEFTDNHGRLFVDLEKMAMLKSEIVTEPTAPPVESPKAETPPEKTAASVPSPTTLKIQKFPEGTWTIRSQTRNDRETIGWNNVLTIRGANFQYDMTQTHDLIDPVNNPWTTPPNLRGLHRYSYASRFTGKVIRSDATSFMVKVANQRVINKQPEGLRVKLVIRQQGAEWTFLRTNSGGLTDKNEPSTEFHRVNSEGGGNAN